jgi:acyl-CoA synthetase (AMP-forming)/AMP-acid ligase II
VPDEEGGNTVRAVVPGKDGEQMQAREIMDLCRGEVDGYKMPRSVVFNDQWPFSPVGKLLRQEIRELYEQPD